MSKLPSDLEPKGVLPLVAQYASDADPRNLMYPRDGRPNPTPGVHPCIDNDCGAAHQVQTGLGEQRPAGQPQMTIIGDPEISSGRAAERWNRSASKFRQKEPSSPESYSTALTRRNGLG